jgi:hypothetical protein
MPPHEPSASCRSRIHCSARSRAAAVDGDERVLPSAVRRWHRRVAGAQLVDRETGAADGPVGRDDGERDDGLARPAGEVVDVERRPPGQEDQLWRKHGDVVPVPHAEQRQPDLREHPGALEAAELEDRPPGGRHVPGVGGVAGQTQADVGLDRGRHVRGAVVEGGPAAVVPLAMPDPARGRLGLARSKHTEDVTQEQVFGVNGDVGLELALPPALGRLLREQVLDGEVEPVPARGPGVLHLQGHAAALAGGAVA